MSSLILLLAKEDLCVKISRFNRRKLFFNTSSTRKSNESDFFERKDEHKIDCRLMTHVVLTEK
jgi:hypothetical protein